jgi:hypothetical protein
LAEVREVLVIGECLDWKWESMEIVMPGLEGTDDSEEFPIIDVIVPFCRAKGLGEVRAGVPVTIGVSLEEDSAQSVLRDVGGDGEWSREVRHVENGFREEQRFQGMKAV